MVKGVLCTEIRKEGLGQQKNEEEILQFSAWAWWHAWRERNYKHGQWSPMWWHRMAPRNSCLFSTVEWVNIKQRKNLRWMEHYMSYKQLSIVQDYKVSHEERCLRCFTRRNKQRLSLLLRASSFSNFSRLGFFPSAAFFFFFSSFEESDDFFCLLLPGVASASKVV